ncbi:MAG: STAS/SEC14 domain-containing protein [Deltaproteobacteria bacterium]|nr:STAS/SEC14 domain-containing protein [Deltaproteobacteria bacterium]
MRDDGIIYGVALPDSQQSLEDARENVECVRSMAAGQRVPLLVDIRHTGTLSREARMLYGSEEGAGAINALALVGDSAFSRVVGNLFIRLSKARFPTRLFSSTDEAIAWLRKSADV